MGSYSEGRRSVIFIRTVNKKGKENKAGKWSRQLCS